MVDAAELELVEMRRRLEARRAERARPSAGGAAARTPVELDRPQLHPASPTCRDCAA